jgi:hypothetical protein
LAWVRDGRDRSEARAFFHEDPSNAAVVETANDDVADVTGARSAAIESWDDTSAGGRAFDIVIAHRAMSGLASAKARIEFHASRV